MSVLCYNLSTDIFFRIISINRGKLARAGLLTVPAVARSGDRPQLPNLLRRYLFSALRPPGHTVRWFQGRKTLFSYCRMADVIRHVRLSHLTWG